MRQIRVIGMLALVGAAAVLLAGCVELDVSVDIRGDGTGSTDITATLDRSAWNLVSQGKSVEEFEEEAGEDVDISETDDGVVVHRAIDFRYDEDGVDGEVGVGLSVVRNDDSTATFELDPADTGGETAEIGEGLGFDALYDDYQVRVAFPGAVESASHGGDIDGNTVTWDYSDVKSAVDAGEPLTAKGSLDGFPWPILIGAAAALLGILVIGAAVAVVILLTRRRGAPAAPVGQPEPAAVPSPAAPAASADPVAPAGDPAAPTAAAPDPAAAGTAPAPPPAANWYPDPYGAAQWRWWDGAAWTDRTSGEPLSRPE